MPDRQVHVLCLNDYPEAVYESEEKAARERAKRNDPDNGRYFHIRSVPFVESS